MEICARHRGRYGEAMTAAMFMAMTRRAAPRLLLTAVATAGLIIAAIRPLGWVGVLFLVALLGVGTPLLTSDWWHRVRTGSAPPRGVLQESPAGTWVDSVPIEVASALSGADARRGEQLLTGAGAMAVANPTR